MPRRKKRLDIKLIKQKWRLLWRYYSAIKARLRLNAEFFVLAGTSKQQVSDVYGHSSHVSAAALDNLVSL
jgi:hypothetical protein